MTADRDPTGRRPRPVARAPGCATSPSAIARRRSSSGWRSPRSLMIVLPKVPPLSLDPARAALVRRLRQRRRLRPPGDGPQRGRRPGRPARPRLRRVLRHRRVHLRLLELAVLAHGPAVPADAPRRRRGGGGLRHRPRRADPAAARRLPGDHDPRLRRDRADRLPEPRQLDARARTASAASTGRRRCRCIGEFSAAHARSPTSSLMAGHRDHRDDPALSAPGFAGRAAPGTRSARTSWPPRPTASTRSRPSSWRSPWAPRRPAWPASSTPRS